MRKHQLLPVEMMQTCSLDGGVRDFHAEFDLRTHCGIVLGVAVQESPSLQNHLNYQANKEA